MRKFLAILALVLAPVCVTALKPAPAAAQTAISISLFFEDLAPHGRWFQHPRFGWAWFPTAIDRDWRPYSRGRWVWTEEYGWYWVSDEPFGWAVYHYGRWAYDEVYGWIWVPGDTWGPAWVAFRYGDDYAGWAPLPPETLSVSFDWAPTYTELSAIYYQPRWVFVPRRHFLSPRIYAYAVPPTRNYYFIQRTANVTRYERGHRGVFNRSIDPRRLESLYGRRITPVRINPVNDRRRVGIRPGQGNVVNVYRPAVRFAPNVAPPPAARARPQDRPRVVIRRDATAPSERRIAPPPTQRPQPHYTVPQQPDTRRPQPQPRYTVPQQPGTQQPRMPTPHYTLPQQPASPQQRVAPRPMPQPQPQQRVAPPTTTPKPPAARVTPRPMPQQQPPQRVVPPRATTPPTGALPRTVTQPPKPPATRAAPPRPPAKVQQQPKPRPRPSAQCGGPGQPACPPR